MKQLLDHSYVKIALTLTSIALIGTTFLTIIYQLTSPTIQHNEQQKEIALIQQLVDSSKYDNDILNDFKLQLPHHLLNNSEPIKIYRAMQHKKPYAVVFETIAPDGYNGNIRLLIAINVQNDSILGVRVIQHKETPSLGDYIELSKDQWILQFQNSLSNIYLDESKWKVKKDGGTIEYRAGATITPRAVTKATQRAFLFYQQNKSILLQKN